MSTNGLNEEASTSSSDELLMCVEDVKYRGAVNGPATGQLRVYEKRIAWADTDGHEHYNCLYENVKLQRVSPPEKPKVQLQICPLAGDAVSFQFVNVGGISEQLSHRDSVKELLQQLLPKCRQTIHQPQQHHNHKATSLRRKMIIEQKKKVLESDTSLRRLYKDLVESGVISSSEFWDRYAKNRGIALESGQGEEVASKDGGTQSIGVSSGFLSNLSRMDGCNGVKFSLNRDTIEAVFRTFPAVKDKHQRLVPSDMTEEEFWTKFFESQYYHRESNEKDSKALKQIFAECVNMDDSDMEQLIKLGVADGKVDLGEVIETGFNYDICDDVSGRPTTDKAALMRRFNYRSSRVLNAGLGLQATSKSTTVGASLPQTSHTHKRHLATEEVPSSSVVPKRPRFLPTNSSECDDLAADSNGDSVPLTMKSTSSSSSYNSSQGDIKVDTLETREKYIEIFQTVLRNATSTVHSTTDANELTNVLVVGSTDCFRNAWEDRQSTKESLLSLKSIPRSTCEEARALQTSLSELLRHFWCCFPVSSQELSEKLERMVETLRKFESAKLNPTTSRLSSEFLQPMKLQLNLALAKYKSWTKRNG